MFINVTFKLLRLIWTQSRHWTWSTFQDSPLLGILDFLCSISCETSFHTVPTYQLVYHSKKNHTFSLSLSVLATFKNGFAMEGKGRGCRINMDAPLWTKLKSVWFYFMAQAHKGLFSYRVTMQLEHISHHTSLTFILPPLPPLVPFVPSLDLLLLSCYQYECDFIHLWSLGPTYERKHETFAFLRLP